MTELETRLREMMEEQVDSVVADRTRQRPTMRRARTRRVGTVLVSLVAVLTVVGGGVIAVRSIGEPAAFGPAGGGQEGEARTWGWDGSNTNEYPEIARGMFNDREWVLEGRREEIDGGTDKLVLTISVEASDDDTAVQSATVDVLPNDDPLVDQELLLSDGSARVVFGATFDEVHSVEAALEGEGRQAAFIATGYDNPSTITAQYFVMFLRPEPDGYLFARDWHGLDFEREPIGDAPEIEPESLPLLSGAFGGKPWTVEANRTDSEMCMNILVHRGPGEGRCFTAEQVDGSLVVHTGELGPDAKALIGFLPLDHTNLQITTDGRTLPLRHSFDPHEKIGFPFALVLGPDDHGTVSAVDGEGDKVSVDF